MLAYFGFWIWALSNQLLLFNPICFVAFAIVLQRFFKDRIKDEEYSLEVFFGNEYKEYKLKTKIYIPFV